MGTLLWLAAFIAVASAAVSKNDELECMFLGYPDLEYDGYDRTEVRWVTVTQNCIFLFGLLRGRTFSLLNMAFLGAD